MSHHQHALRVLALAPGDPIDASGEAGLRQLMLACGRSENLGDGASIDLDPQTVSLVVSGGLGLFADVDHLCVSYFGRGALFLPRSGDTAGLVTQAVGPTTVTSVAKRDAIAALGEAAAERQFAAIAMAACCLAQDEAACIGRDHIRQRAARWLDRLAPDDEGPVLLTQERMAQLLGVQRTSVNGACQILRDEGVIRFARGKLTIRDRAALRRIAGGGNRDRAEGSLQRLAHSAVMPAW